MIRTSMVRFASIPLPVGSFSLERRTYKFLGRLALVGVSVTHELTVTSERFPVVVLGHQKHTPLSWPRTRSETPRKCNRIVARRYSILLALMCDKTLAAVAAFLTVSISVVGSVIRSHLRHRFAKVTTMTTRYQINLNSNV